MSIDEVKKWRMLVPHDPTRVKDEIVRGQAVEELKREGEIRVIDWKIENTGELMKFVASENQNDSYRIRITSVIVFYLIR